MSDLPSRADLEAALGHAFRDGALLREALTHPSARGKGEAAPDNERLEFLGDAVLQLAVTERLYDFFPAAPEGLLTQWRAALVSRSQMAKVGEAIGLGGHLAMGFGEERNQGRSRGSNLANAIEAVLGAVFRDAGYPAARGVVLRLLGAEISALASLDEAAAAAVTGNAKGELQELLQREGGEPPRYRCVREEGLAHDRVYEVAVEWNGAALGQGTGKSKQEAEVAAARDALHRRRAQAAE